MKDETEPKKSGIVSMQVEDSIGILTIENGKYNVLDYPNFMDLEIFKEWVKCTKIKALIIIGKGRHFSAGADLEYLKNSKEHLEELKRRLSEGKKILNYIESLPIITVAAVSGACFGGGLEIALSCKYIIATQNALFAFPEATLGILPGLGGTARLPERIGKNRALEVILSGRQITTEEAYKIGLIDGLCENKKHLDTCKEFINKLALNKSEEQISGIMELVDSCQKVSPQVIMEKEENIFINLVRNLR